MALAEQRRANRSPGTLYRDGNHDMIKAGYDNQIQQTTTARDAHLTHLNEHLAPITDGFHGLMTNFNEPDTELNAQHNPYKKHFEQNPHLFNPPAQSETMSQHSGSIVTEFNPSSQPAYHANNSSGTYQQQAPQLMPNAPVNPYSMPSHQHYASNPIGGYPANTYPAGFAGSSQYPQPLHNNYPPRRAITSQPFNTQFQALEPLSDNRYQGLEREHGKRKKDTYRQKEYVQAGTSSRSNHGRSTSGKYEYDLGGGNRHYEESLSGSDNEYSDSSVRPKRKPHKSRDREYNLGRGNHHYDERYYDIR